MKSLNLTKKSFVLHHPTLFHPAEIRTTENEKGTIFVKIFLRNTDTTKLLEEPCEQYMAMNYIDLVSKAYHKLSKKFGY